MSEASSSPPGVMRSVVIAIVSCSALVLLLPLPPGMKPEGQRLIAATILMAGLWVTQAIPLAATSLLPLALFPLLGIQSAKDVSQAYINDKVFLYLGGFVIALGIERWNLHRRIALNIVNVVGVSPRRLVLGFLIATGGLSMWISNTASTLLMLPIAIALLKTLDDEQTADSSNRTSDSAVGLISEKLAVPLLLAIAYSASIGGLTTIVGTPTNNQAIGIYNDLFPNAPRISFAQWMIAILPIGAVYMCVAWVVLTWGLPKATQHDGALRAELRTRLQSLGRASTAERRMLIVFAATAILWVFRQKLEIGATVIPGWSLLSEAWFSLLGTSMTADQLTDNAGSFVNDSTVAMLMAVLLFCIPSGTKTDDGRSVPLMNWSTASKLPWDIMLLFGGGFALAGAFRTTELSEWLGQVLQGPLQQMPMWLVIATVCLLVTFLTEFSSNIATVSALTPTLAAICVALKVDPRLLLVPATLAASCAFMLPIATPPNAIVFGSGRLKVRDMVCYGIYLNLVGVPILTAGTYLFIKPLMGIP
ncbi:MAG: SLC13 family permease [Fuerstiella sp.]|nr:SLC13 family permease [Fuerstiella sp.]